MGPNLPFQHNFPLLSTVHPSSQTKSLYSSTYTPCLPTTMPCSFYSLLFPSLLLKVQILSTTFPDLAQMPQCLPRSFPSENGIFLPRIPTQCCYISSVVLNLFNFIFQLLYAMGSLLKESMPCVPILSI